MNRNMVLAAIGTLIVGFGGGFVTAKGVDGIFGGGKSASA